MSNTKKIITFDSLDKLVRKLRSESDPFISVYAYNGTGKTRLSAAFKDKGKRGGAGDTLYFNAFTEDLFNWDNDIFEDKDRKLIINHKSEFLKILANQDIDIETKIFNHLKKYADFDFDIRLDDEQWVVYFYTRNWTEGDPPIKVSRGEENLFIWCTFLAICELAIDQQQTYSWVKYIYIDDPISSLDDNNVIALTCDLAKILQTAKDKIKVIISSHHGLFFNIMCNELKKYKNKSYFLYRNKETNHYQLQATGDTPFFYHVAMLKELKDASDTGNLYTYHFNMLRSIMEKTASFFGATDFSFCIKHLKSEALFSRALNIMSHGNYSVYDPKQMIDDNKRLFAQILEGFLQKYPFQLPNLEPVVTAPPATAPTDLQDTQP